jgi:hypothetical protein
MQALPAVLSVSECLLEALLLVVLTPVLQDDPSEAAARTRLDGCAAKRPLAGSRIPECVLSSSKGALAEGFTR